MRYHHINTAIGALECAKLELYRRVAAPYEDKAIEIGMLQTQQQAIMGNIDLARSTAQRTLELEFAPIQTAIDKATTLQLVSGSVIASVERHFMFRSTLASTSR
jgi:hypothetical protein